MAMASAGLYANNLYFALDSHFYSQLYSHSTPNYSLLNFADQIFLVPNTVKALKALIPVGYIYTVSYTHLTLPTTPYV